jgi:uncharacterized membrane protein
VTSPSPSPSIPAPGRWDAIDVARGVAILAMIVYHAAWDLSFLQLVEANIVQDPGWRWFARIIAGSFLVLAGIGLALAHAKGLRPRPFLLRLGKVGGAALAITAATLLAFPDSFIFFGILHCIALGSVLALPFLRAPAAVTLAVAALVLVAPRFVTAPVFDRPALEWLGLGAQDPTTNDYVPVFPWFGLILLGVAAGRGLMRRPGALARWRADGLWRALAWAGRKSLPIYLVHQVVLFGALSGLASVVGPNPVAQCAADCTRQSGNAAVCRTTCRCVVERVREAGALGRITAGPLSEADRDLLGEAARMCRRAP